MHDRQRVAAGVARGVRVLEGRRKLGRDVRDAGGRQRASGAAQRPMTARERRAVDELHGEEIAVVDAAEVEGLDNPRMRERGFDSFASSTNMVRK